LRLLPVEGAIRSPESGTSSRFHVLVVAQRSLTQRNLSNGRNYQPCSEVWDTFREILLLSGLARVFVIAFATRMQPIGSLPLRN